MSIEEEGEEEERTPGGDEPNGMRISGGARDRIKRRRAGKEREDEFGMRKCHVINAATRNGSEGR